MTLASMKPAQNLDSQARKLTKDATRVGFWGGFTLDTSRVFVSKSAADISSNVLKAGMAHRIKSDAK